MTNTKVNLSQHRH